MHFGPDHLYKLVPAAFTQRHLADLNRCMQLKFEDNILRIMYALVESMRVSLAKSC